MATAEVHRGVLNTNTSAIIDSCWFFQSVFSQAKLAEGGGKPYDIQFAGLESFLSDECISPTGSATSFETCTSPSSLDASWSFDDEDLPSDDMLDIDSTSIDSFLANDTRDEYSDSELRQVFDKFDENGDGLICCKDLNQFIRRLGFEMSNEEAMSLLKCVDHNEDNAVDFEEFCSLYHSKLSNQDAKIDGEEFVDVVGKTKQEKPEEEANTLLEAFRVFDKNQDGHITPLELQEVLRDLGFPEGKSLKACERMIRRVDSDGNGQIDITEFMALMTYDCFQV